MFLQVFIISEINTVFIWIDAPGAKTRFWEGTTFKNEKVPIFMLTCIKFVWVKKGNAKQLFIWCKLIMGLIFSEAHALNSYRVKSLLFFSRTYFVRVSKSLHCWTPLSIMASWNSQVFKRARLRKDQVHSVCFWWMEGKFWPFQLVKILNFEHRLQDFKYLPGPKT